MTGSHQLASGRSVSGGRGKTLRRRGRSAIALFVLVALAAVPVLGANATAQSVGVDTNGDGVIDAYDTNGDGVADDFDGDGAADDLDGDCIPDDFNGDGVPDGDSTGFECPEGSGGTLQTQLSLLQVARVLDFVFLQFPDVTEPGEEPDGFPNLPRTTDPDTGEDVPDWGSLDRVLGEPGARDLLQLPDDGINQAMLEFEDINNVDYINPVTGETEFVATPDALAYTLAQIAKIGGDDGLIAGSGSALKGPCLGQVWSYDSDGQPLDVAFDWNREGPPMKYPPDGSDQPLVQAFTSSDPFKVHVDGAVIYTGIAGGFENGTGPWEHDWFINMNFLGFAGMNVDTGGDPNGNYKNRNAGAVNLNEDLPAAAKISGLAAVNGKMQAPGTGNGAPGDQNNIFFECVASGFVELKGGIPLTAPGAALVFISTVGMLFNARPAKTWGGV
jgi:hypothetical protein